MTPAARKDRPVTEPAPAAERTEPLQPAGEPPPAPAPPAPTPTCRYMLGATACGATATDLLVGGAAEEPTPLCKPHADPFRVVVVEEDGVRHTYDLTAPI